MMTTRRRLSPASIVAVATLLVLAVLPALLSGQHSPDGNVPTYDAVLTVKPDGRLHVREAFTFDYERSERRGLLHQIRSRQGNREFSVEHINVSSTTHAPTNVRKRTFMHQLQLRIGEGHRVSGRHAYVITYEVTGAIAKRGDRDEVLWDALGPGWPVPVAEAVVRVQAPFPFFSGCLAGRGEAVTKCAKIKQSPTVIDFIQTSLRAREGMTVRASFKRGKLNLPPPDYAPPHLNFTLRGLLAIAAGTATALALRRRLPPPARPIALAAAAALFLWDVLPETVPEGIWHAAIGDLSLYATACLSFALIADSK